MLVKTTKRLFKTLAIKVDSVVRRERDWAQLQKMAKTVGIYNQGAEPGGSGWKLLRDGWQSRKACSAGPGLLHPRGGILLSRGLAKSRLCRPRVDGAKVEACSRTENPAQRVKQRVFVVGIMSTAADRFWVPSALSLKLQMRSLPPTCQPGESRPQGERGGLSSLGSDSSQCPVSWENPQGTRLTLLLVLWGLTSWTEGTRRTLLGTISAHSPVPS